MKDNYVCSCKNPKIAYDWIGARCCLCGKYVGAVEKSGDGKNGGGGSGSEGYGGAGGSGGRPMYVENFEFSERIRGIEKRLDNIEEIVGREEMKIITDTIKFTELYKEIRDILISDADIPSIFLIESLAGKIAKRIMCWKLVRIDG